MRSVRSTDDVVVAVHDLGGVGPPLLLAHATGFHGLVWAPLAAALAATFSCTSFDERGHGDSTAPADRGYDWQGFADDVLGVVDGLGLERAFGVGHSAGGAALLLAEARRPGTFRALYCFEPVVPPVDPPAGPSPDNPLSEGALRRRDVFASRAEALANFAAKPPFASLDPDARRAYVDHGFVERPDGTVALKCRPEDEAQMYRMGTAHDAYARLGEVRCPVVLACGADTNAWGPAALELQAARLPSARIEVMAGLGHFGPLQDPVAVAAGIRRAFADTP